MDLVFDEKGYFYKGFLGNGGFGQVYLVEDKTTKEFKAIKQVIANDEFDESVREAEILSSIRFKNIVQYFDHFNGNLRIYIDGDLAKLISQKRKNNTKFAESEIFNYSAQILYGLDFLHSKDIIHRDIKPANIFLKENKIKIGDLGLARSIKTLQSSKTIGGTANYMSPEMVRGDKHYTTKVDVWSFGCVLYELITLEKAFDEEVLHKTFDSILNKEVKMPKQINSTLDFILTNSLNKIPDKRKSAKDLLFKIIPETLEVKINFSSIFKPISAEVKSNFFKAVEEGNLEIVRESIDKLIDIDIQDSHGVGAFQIAVREEHLQIIKELIEKGAKPYLSDLHFTKLHFFCWRNNKSEVLDLLKILRFRKSKTEKEFETKEEFDKIKINSKSRKGYTPLHMAVFGNQIEIVKLLLKLGADPNPADNESNTPLDWAQQHGYEEIAKILIEHDPNLKSHGLLSKNIVSPLSLRIENKSIENNLKEVKFMLIGDGCVGKTSLLKRYLNDQYTNLNDQNTFLTDVDIYSRTANICGIPIKFSIFDVDGSRYFQKKEKYPIQMFMLSFYVLAVSIRLVMII